MTCEFCGDTGEVWLRGIGDQRDPGCTPETTVACVCVTDPEPPPDDDGPEPQDADDPHERMLADEWAVMCADMNDAIDGQVRS